MKFNNKKQYDFNGIRISCKSIKEAKLLLKIAHEQGYKWSSKKSYLEETHWYDGVKEVHYDIARGYYNDFYYDTISFPDDVISFEKFIRTRVLT